MPTILVTGIPHTDRDSIAAFVLSRYSSRLPKVELLAASKFKAKLRGKNNLVVSCDIFSKYDSTFEPSLPPHIKEAKKDMTIIFEIETDRPEINEWQEMNRAYAAANFSCRIRIIKVKKNSLNPAIREFFEALREVLL